MYSPSRQSVGLEGGQGCWDCSRRSSGCGEGVSDLACFNLNLLVVSSVTPQGAADKRNGNAT